MKRYLRQLTRDYLAALKKYHTDAQEAVLAEAYEIGRGAIARGLGVLEMTRVQQQALESFDWPAMKGSQKSAFLKSIHAFFMESLSPFEVTHRGFRETNIRLHHLINALERRNLDLARINRELSREIIQRKRTERALRESENHLRELFDEAERMQENLRSLSNQILNAQEEERKRISRELHDDVGQGLVAVSMALASMGHRTADKKGDMDDGLREAHRLLDHTMKRVHDFARELRPATLDQLGLLPALRAYLDEFSKRTGLRIEFKGDPAAEDLGGEQKIVLYRIAQESLTNVAKHAHATSVKVTLQKVRDGIRMEVADDGRSFSEKPAKDGVGTRRLGLLGMRERARLVNGTFDVRPCPGKGTTTCTLIPFASPQGMSLPDHPGNGRQTNGRPARRRSRAALKTAVKRRSLPGRN